jgi:hypothetical protein
MKPSRDVQEDQGLVTRIGRLEIEWPKAIGYFGGIWLAVAYDLIAPPIGLFIAAIPILKLLKHPDQPRPIRIVSDALEGAAKPVGGDAESTIRLAPRTTAVISRKERRIARPTGGEGRRLAT